MKYLTLIRHAKSSWDHPGMADHDRPLNARGLRAAPAVAGFLRKTYFGGDGAESLLPAPDCLISSTALRAQSTARILLDQLEMSPDQSKLEQRLYLAPEDRLLSLLRGFDESWKHVVVVGHNPGLHDFANRLLARAKIPRFPTCAVALLALPVEFWALADWSEGQLVGFLTPRTLERRFPEHYQNISGES